MTEKTRQFPCQQCGASLAFLPGTVSLSCSFCGHDNPIASSDEALVEFDFNAYLAQLDQQPITVDVMRVHCDGCAALLDLPDQMTAFDCPFCGHAINTQAQSQRLIKPQALLPFAITRKQGQQQFKQWLTSLWFAPSKLKQFAQRQGALRGIYVPYWTYDTQTHSTYTGQRGEYYWVSQSYTTRVNGRSVRRTRRVRKTRWWPASGMVQRPFDDVLVLASASLPLEITQKLEPWDLPNLLPFAEDYLAGFQAQSYQVPLDDGFERAKNIIAPVIHQDVCRDIGGDVQRVHTLQTQHDQVTFKHVLLPIWISAYRWKQKLYHFVINGRTGEVQGQRPWSYWKIAAAITALFALAGLVAGTIALLR